MGKMISFKRPDGQSVNGYLAEPQAGSKAPGMVVIQEWWGLNNQIKSVADKLAGAGYRALVPDLYRGKVALAANEAEHLMTNLNFGRSEEHTSELQSRQYLVCRLLLEKKKQHEFEQ